jgi:hypothetical protein
MRTLLLNRFDLTPEGKLVERAEIGEEGYAENVEYNLSMHPNSEGISLEWYGEDDTTISLEEYLELVDDSNLEL